MRILRFVAVTLSLSLCSSAGLASADDGAVALLPFQGAQAAKVRQNVQKGLAAADVDLVPLKRVTAVARNTKGYAERAAKLDAGTLVRTRVRRVEGRWVGDTEVRNAKGQRVEKFRSTSSSSTRLSNRIVAALMKSGRMPVASAAGAAAAAPRAEPETPAPIHPRLVVRPFTGAQAGKIRGAAVRGLRSEPVEFFPNKHFAAKAKSMGVNLKSNSGHVAPASALAVSGLIDGDVLYEDRVWSAYVRLIDGDSAKVISQHYYDASTSAALAKSVQARIGSDFRKDIRKLGVAVPGAAVAAPVAVAATTRGESTSSEKKEKDEPKPKAKKKRKGDRPAAVDIQIDFRVVHRKFGYEDDLRGDLRDYTLKAGPGVGVKFQYYPGAHFTAGVGAQFGIDFEWERLFKIDSTRADGATFPTESQQFLIGLRWRYPKGRWEPSVVLGYGVHRFSFGLSGPPVPGEDNTAGIPSVKYEFVRLGGGFRVAIGKNELFILAASVAFRGTFSVGGIGTNVWFPQAKANGMDALLMMGFALPKGFEIRLSGDYRRYGFDLNPVPPDPPYVAGGALDQYFGGALGVAWRR
ncbi:MAG: hypothetical protein HKN10_11265 [Myxococcales bacterium]|nr:hypothetical protein [Myxococcales bacterium]